MFPWYERFLFRERTEDRKRRFKEIGQKVYEFFDETAIAVGYQMRIGQLDMSCDIVDGLREKKHVLVEASVGIGKSCVYCSCFVLYPGIWSSCCNSNINDSITGTAEERYRDYKANVRYAHRCTYSKRSNTFFVQEANG